MGEEADYLETLAWGDEGARAADKIIAERKRREKKKRAWLRKELTKLEREGIIKITKKRKDYLEDE